MRVAACLVTRGNVPMDDIIESLPHEWEVVVWDNSKRADVAVAGRYAAIELTEAEIIYVQDDDCVLEPESIDALVSRAKMMPFALFANMPERFRPHYPDSCLVGFGAAFGRDLPGEAFARAGTHLYEFNRTADVYFTTLTKMRFLLDQPYRDQPWASDPDRMWKQPEHVPMRAAALRLARTLR